MRKSFLAPRRRIPKSSLSRRKIKHFEIHIYTYTYTSTTTCAYTSIYLYSLYIYLRGCAFVRRKYRERMPRKASYGVTGGESTNKKKTSKRSYHDGEGRSHTTSSVYIVRQRYIENNLRPHIPPWHYKTRPDTSPGPLPINIPSFLHTNYCYSAARADATLTCLHAYIIIYNKIVRYTRARKKRKAALY